MSNYYPPSKTHPWQVTLGIIDKVSGLTSLEEILDTVDLLDAWRRAEDTSRQLPWMVSISCGKPLTYLGLDIGIGIDRVPVFFHDDARNEMTRSLSDQDQERERQEPLVFTNYGQRIWTTSATLVAYLKAREALEQYLLTGLRPTIISWEDE